MNFSGPKQIRRHCKSYNIPGHAHELTFSCYQRLPLLAKDRTRQWLCDSLSAASRSLDFAIYAYVIMPEHAHIIVHPRQTEYHIAAILKAIKLPVARRAMRFLEREAPQWLPKLTRTRGRRTEQLFWQSGGGYDRNIEKPETLLKMIDYIHNNPVRRGLVDAPSDWQWSSAADYADLREEPVPINTPSL